MKIRFYRLLFLAGTLLPLCGCGSYAAHYYIGENDLRPIPYPGVAADAYVISGCVLSVPPTYGGSLLVAILFIVDIPLSALVDTVFLPWDICAWKETGKCPESATWLEAEELDPKSVSLDGNLLVFRFAIDRAPWFAGSTALGLRRNAGNLRVGVMEQTRCKESVLAFRELPQRAKEICFIVPSQTYFSRPSVSIHVASESGKDELGFAKEEKRERVAKVELVFELSEDFRGSFTFGKSTLFVDRASENPIKFET